MPKARCPVIARGDEIADYSRHGPAFGTWGSLGWDYSPQCRKTAPRGAPTWRRRAPSNPLYQVVTTQPTGQPAPHSAAPVAGNARAPRGCVEATTAACTGRAGEQHGQSDLCAEDVRRASWCEGRHEAGLQSCHGRAFGERKNQDIHRWATFAAHVAAVRDVK